MESNNRLRSTSLRDGNRLHKRRHLYVADADQAIWEAAESWCKAKGVSMSSLVPVALDEYLNSRSADEEYVKALRGEV